MDDLLIPRRFCNCSCHQGIVDHIALCCKPDGAEADGVLHSAQYYDTERNLPLRCCANDDNGDGNCHIHSAPGVYRKQGFNSVALVDCPHCGGAGLLPGKPGTWDEPGESSKPCTRCDGKGQVYQL